MRVRIDVEDNPGGIRAARAYTKQHVIIARDAIDRIAALARKHGIYEELKALEIHVSDIVLDAPAKRLVRR
jgi:hypothetical protein